MPIRSPVSPRLLFSREFRLLSPCSSRITDQAAIIFAEEFYAAIADKYPVDAALAAARKAIFAAGNDIEWGTPVLFLRAPTGQLFSLDRAVVRQAEGEPSVTPPASPVSEPPPPPKSAEVRLPISLPKPEETEVVVHRQAESAHALPHETANLLRFCQPHRQAAAA
jgi:hypothetical protein